MSKFGERLKYLRKQSNVSQDDLAKRLGVTRSCVANYEQGTREPNFEDLERIADAFNVEIDYLVGKSDETASVSANPLTEKEKLIIHVYRKDKHTREMIDHILRYYDLFNEVTHDA